jgi:YfiH family protein
MKSISFQKFQAKHLTTTKKAGNMKNVEIRNKFLISQGIDPKSLVLANQTHSNKVIKVTKDEGGKFIDDCDGLITDDASLSLGVFSADCMPILMVSKDKRVKAAVHAGWRGLAKGVLENAIDLFFTQYNVAPYEIKAYIAPHIQKCCYEVNPSFGDIFGVQLDERNRLSLSEVAKEKMRKNGIRIIYISKLCTKCETNLCFSHRLDKTTDRLLTII